MATHLKFAAILVCVAVGFTGCAGVRSAKKDGANKDTASAGGDIDGAATPGVDVSEANIRGTEFAEIAELKNIRFEYDAYSLDESARSSLKANAEYLKSHKELEVLVSGHCDDRGTIQYNLALGQKRAKVVREFYMRLGVSGKSVATISYGEEKPACMDATESCWSENRRAETRIRARTASSNKDGMQRQIQ